MFETGSEYLTNNQEALSADTETGQDAHRGQEA